MTTNAVEPGWHPDPSNPGGALRWWDGSAWTEHTQPATATPVAPAASSYGPSATALAYGTGGYGTGGYGGSGYGAGGYSQGKLTFVQRNKLSLTTAAVVVVYVVVAFSTRVVFIGIFPVLMSIRATRRREQLAPLAIVAAVVAVGIAFLALR